MKRIVAIALCVVSANISAEPSVCPEFLPSAVETKLVPVLEALAAAMRKSDAWDKAYENAFAKLLKAKDSASRQARVALMDYYVGESYGEELVCAVALDGVKSKTFLELHSRCDIKPTRSAVPRNRNLPLREYTLNMLKDGNAKQSCTYE